MKKRVHKAYFTGKKDRVKRGYDSSCLTSWKLVHAHTHKGRERERLGQ